MVSRFIIMAAALLLGERAFGQGAAPHAPGLSLITKSAKLEGSPSMPKPRQEALRNLLVLGDLAALDGLEGASEMTLRLTMDLQGTPYSQDLPVWYLMEKIKDVRTKGSYSLDRTLNSITSRVNTKTLTAAENAELKVKVQAKQEKKGGGK